jgi:23S rRNA (adenine2503-C2)-methyltransferase
MTSVSDAAMKIVTLSGEPLVAEVAIAQFRNDPRFMLEIVDGLAPPLDREEKWIINVSTQFGCPVGCPYCDAGFAFVGNPTAAELLAQVRWALSRHPDTVGRCRKLKVHFARMGEPALNDAVLQALIDLPSVVTTGRFWVCLATVAPRGREGWFEELLQIKHRLYRGRFQLQFSVQSTREADRNRLVPIPHWTLEEIAAYGRRFFEPNDRTVVLNFALANGVAFDPQVLGAVFSPACCAIKITPVNPTERGAAQGVETVLRSARKTELNTLCQNLREQGFDVIESIGDGREDLIGSNCGQSLRALMKANATRERSLIPFGDKRL